MATKKETQSLEQLTRRYQELKDRKIRNDTLLDATQKQLEDLLTEAEELFGTRDVGQLQAKLKQMEDENEKKRTEYQQHLETIEQSLAQITEELDDRDDDGPDSVSRKVPK